MTTAQLLRSSIITVGLLLTVALSTHAQVVSELRCRGGDGGVVRLFVIDKLDPNNLSLNFNSSRQPAGADSSGLEPGTCSWIDRTVRDDEWRQIHFTITSPEERAIETYLKNPNNYWSFFVVNTDRGYFDVKNHRAWTQDSSGLELRCRGGDNELVKLFVFDKLDNDNLSLTFNSSKTPARADGGGLEPATCSWLDRPMRDDEWRQIHFAITGAEAQTVPVALKDSKKFWSFFVVNTDRGFFAAKTHREWVPNTVKNSN